MCSVEFLHWRVNLTQNVSLYFVYLKIEVFLLLETERERV